MYIKLKFILFWFFINVLLFSVKAQETSNHIHHSDDKTCGTASLYNELIKDPDVRKERARLENFTEEYINKGLYKNDKSVKTIPVVFHIIHQYGVENISKDQVLDAVRIINEDFNLQNTDISSVVSNFQGVVGDAGVQFRLARKDPNGNCTDGITRTVSPLTFSANDNVKDLIVWNTNKYLNVWVVNDISFGAGGYTYLPGSQPNQNYRGIVVIHSQLGSIGTANWSNFAARTLTHEIGHFFNLLHTWGWSNEPGIPTNCSMDDGVSDTPNTIGAYGSCNLSQNTCSSLDNVQNFMDYSTCANMFSAGQTLRMNAALSSTVGGLSYLWQPSNLVSTGTNDGYVASTCVPKADFFATPLQSCLGGLIDFYDNSYNEDVDGSWTWQWTFSGGTPSVSSQQNPTVSYNTSGKHNVSLTVSNSAGSHSKSSSQYIHVYPTGGGENVPLFESFEFTGFPSHPNDPNKNWAIENPASSVWHRTTAAAYSGSASLRINNFTAAPGGVYSLVSPNIDMGVISSPVSLTFKLAYAQRNSESSERLRIFVSNNCGRTWVPRYSRTGTGLVTNGGSYVSGNFIPNTSQWRQETVGIDMLANRSNTLIKFELTSGNGNFLYIDDINITGIVSVEDIQADKSFFEIYPNPISDNSHITFYLSESNETFIDVYDLVGNVISSYNIGMTYAGTHDIKVNNITEKLAAGIYIFKLSSGNFNAVRKAVVIN